jgi:hypothetical protein
MTVMTTERPAAAVAQPQSSGALAVRMGTSEKLAYCRAFAESGMLPRQYRQQPANLLYAVEYAESLGLHPMVAITGVHVIEGKPSASSALIASLVRRAGHKLRVKSSDTQAVAQIIRADDPEFVFEVVWTIEKARTAKLTEKDVWRKYPASMLEARATTAVARQACAEALFGILYTPEELGAEVDADGNLIESQPSFQRQAEGQDAWDTATPARTAATPEAMREGADNAEPRPDARLTPPAEQQPQGDDLSPQARQYLADARAAKSPEDSARVRDEAETAGAPAPFLAWLDRIAAEKWAPAEDGDDPATGDGAEPPMYTGPADGREPVAVTLPGAPASPQDRLGALARLYQVGEAAGLSPDETRALLAQHTGKALVDATGEDIAAFTATLRAAGGAR